MNPFIFLLLPLIGLMTLSVQAFADDDHDGHQYDQPLQLDAEASKKSTTYKYVCPMHPQIIRDHQGTCPICGMDLVRQAFENSLEPPKISAGSATEGMKQGFAIRTAEVQNITLWKYIPTFGRVVVDESKVIHIHPRASGWISDLSVRSNGEKVKAGQLLYKIYAPEIVSAQQDLILAVQNRQRIGRQANSLLESTRVRLQLLGMEPKTIRTIEKGKKTLHQIPVYAKQSGVVSNLTVQNGMYVQPQTELMAIENLSTVWIEAEVLPLQQSWIKQGLTADISSEAFPEQRWESQIDYIYPVTDAKTQVAKVRLPVMNKDEILKPNMLMDIAIYGGPKSDVVAIPLEAVVDDGLRKRVVQQLKDGRFQVKEVVTGMQSRGIVEVTAGLEAGDRVVVSGQFLMDSESQIQENLRRLMDSGTKASSEKLDSHAGHAH